MTTVQQDADRMKELLQQMQFEITELKDPSSEEVGQYLQNTIEEQFQLSKSGKKTTIWVYFAGLGFFDYGDAAMKVHLDDESPLPLELLLRYLG